jgi:TonB family protein
MRSGVRKGARDENLLRAVVVAIVSAISLTLFAQTPKKCEAHPLVIRKEEPTYTEKARRAKLQGTVRIEAEIDPSGRVMNPRVISPPLGLGLEENAVKALRKSRFGPGSTNGELATCTIGVEYTFRLL